MRPGEHTGCENCRKTERTLAQAIGIIEELTKAQWMLDGAWGNVRTAEQRVEERRVEAAKWLEEL
jgi:hypothetical protein